ncbi:hypothetical protein AB0D90_24700 [Streptomyces althioticus]|uniref:hypothetical protein n=1 Tax=Streptomyces althioticus TaxID=83380 RepID=UPI0033F78EE8
MQPQMPLQLPRLHQPGQDELGQHRTAQVGVESNWEDGREDITQQLDALADMSDAVVREFNKLENELTKQVNEKMRVEDKRPKKGNGAE